MTARFREKCDRAFRIFDRAKKQFGQSDIGDGVVRVNEQTLLVISSCFRKASFRFLTLVLPLERPRLIVVNLSKQIVGLIFFWVLSNDFFQHLDGLRALVCQNKTGGEFFSSVGVIGLQFEHAQVKRNCFFNLLGGGIVIGDLLKNRRVVGRVLDRLGKYFVKPTDFIRLGLGIWFEYQRGIEFTQS